MPSKLLEVRDTVASLRAALLVPSAEGLDRQMPELHLAALTLERLQGEGLHGIHSEPAAPEADGLARDLTPDLAGLARDLRACSRLIAQGLAITQGMARLLIPPSATYQPGGEPVPPPAGSRLLVRG